MIFFFIILDGGYAPAHQQSQTIYQTQGGPPSVVQNQQPPQSNPAQSLSNQQNQARLTTMSQPTAPPTPPNQQQQQQSQAPQYVQIQQQGLPSQGGVGNPRGQQYRAQVPRQRQQQINQQYFYQPQMGGVPYSFVIPPGAHVRGPAYGYMPIQSVFNNYATAAQPYGQMAAPSNGQQRQSTPQAPATSMAPPQANEYPYTSLEVYPPVMQAQPVPTQAQPPPQQKTVKKTGSKAIKIINPVTGKDIFAEDSSSQSTGGANSGTSGASIATVDKAITASHNELNKDEAVEKETSTTTPVVSAMSDGPSVDITPKHQVNKIKKL